jgi:D-alanine-D-alanine ligase and related ATP-grasp enzymes
MAKTRVAVFFGGRSPEHDVSVISALQAMDALDTSRYEIIPVYVSLTGEWFLGEALRERKSYIPDPEMRRQLTRCTLGHTDIGGVLLTEKKGLFSGAGTVAFDVAIPAFHGAFGEDGCFQGLFEQAGIAYTGMRVLGSALAMDKTATKMAVSARTKAKQLPYLAVTRRSPARPHAPELPEGWKYPVIVKPAHMGSSIGVGKADTKEDVEALLQTLFLYDTKAMLEPYVAHRQEYNVAVRRQDGKIITSAIERPKTAAELLDFREKYCQGGGTKGGKLGKQPGQASEGMLSLTRDINPDISAGLEGDIRGWAAEIFEALDGSGAPRLDFMLDTDSGELWFNEINPCPGSFGYFLWSATKDHTLFSELLDALIEEALMLRSICDVPVDPVPAEARLLKRV